MSRKIGLYEALPNGIVEAHKQEQKSENAEKTGDD